LRMLGEHEMREVRRASLVLQDFRTSSLLFQEPANLLHVYHIPLRAQGNVKQAKAITSVRTHIAGRSATLIILSSKSSAREKNHL
jgi:hypothetical protein